ncbi:hypothetical protein F6X40_11025 [Paraburkholderia sp. UCT31]|uniref:hypothetical protein n=1 Tax=Paraburkholderia sp. UCT31 TaxID=2615209 RepID=UPI001655C832|nr:hypothetical protein [Paraburkholderia sp. UCT31]MBC8737335.1 hypothetical protein [Paraburkholderia sp. UCT31]
MAKISKAALAALQEAHTRYCSFNQTERSDTEFMASNGHPFAKQYQKLRAFFDGLRYACNAGARVFSYKGEHEYAEYWKPELEVTGKPEGELRRFGHVYPAHELWNEYLAAAKELGWKDAGPRLRGGSWVIRTQSPALRDRLLEACAERKPNVRYDTGRGVNVIAVDIYDPSPALHQAIVAALKEHHKGFVLPKRKAEHSQEDQAPLPLAEKQFALGNVKEVTVTDRQVLVPLVPLGQGDAIVQSTANQLLDLVKAGFPFSQVREWLKKFLTADSFAHVENCYG